VNDVVIYDEPSIVAYDKTAALTQRLVLFVLHLDCYDAHFNACRAIAGISLVPSFCATAACVQSERTIATIDWQYGSTADNGLVHAHRELPLDVEVRESQHADDIPTVCTIPRVQFLAHFGQETWF
jgi:hypothetical protein